MKSKKKKERKKTTEFKYRSISSFYYSWKRKKDCAEPLWKITRVNNKVANTKLNQNYQGFSTTDQCPPFLTYYYILKETVLWNADIEK